MCKNIDQNANEYISINDLKKYYISVILKNFASMKKASFLGWSLGGVVALEVCKGLQKNVLIKSLSLVDSIFRSAITGEYTKASKI